MDCSIGIGCNEGRLEAQAEVGGRVASADVDR